MSQEPQQLPKATKFSLVSTLNYYFISPLIRLLYAPIGYASSFLQRPLPDKTHSHMPRELRDRQTALDYYQKSQTLFRGAIHFKSSSIPMTLEYLFSSLFYINKYIKLLDKNSDTQQRNEAYVDKASIYLSLSAVFRSLGSKCTKSAPEEALTYYEKSCEYAQIAKGQLKRIPSKNKIAAKILGQIDFVTADNHRYIVDIIYHTKMKDVESIWRALYHLQQEQSFYPKLTSEFLDGEKELLGSILEPSTIKDTDKKSSGERSSAETVGSASTPISINRLSVEAAILTNKNHQAGIHLHLASLAKDKKDWESCTKHIFALIQCLPAEEEFHECKNKAKIMGDTELVQMLDGQLRDRETAELALVFILELPPLLLACAQNNLPLVQSCLEKDIALAPEGLRWACMMNRTEVIRYFINNYPAIVTNEKNPLYRQIIAPNLVELQDKKAQTPSAKEGAKKTESEESSSSVTKDTLANIHERFATIKETIEGRKITAKNPKLNAKLREENRLKVKFENLRKKPATNKQEELQPVLKQLIRAHKKVEVFLKLQTPTLPEKQPALAEQVSSPSPSEEKPDIKKIVHVLKTASSSAIIDSIMADCKPKQSVTSNKTKLEDASVDRETKYKFTELTDNIPPLPRAERTLGSFLDIQYQSEFLQKKIQLIEEYAEMDFAPVIETQQQDKNIQTLLQLLQIYALVFEMQQYMETLKSMPSVQKDIGSVNFIRNALTHAYWLVEASTKEPGAISKLHQELVVASKVMTVCHRDKNYQKLYKDEFFSRMLAYGEVRLPQEKELDGSQIQANTRLMEKLSSDFLKQATTYNCNKLLVSTANIIKTLTKMYGDRNSYLVVGYSPEIRHPKPPWHGTTPKKTPPLAPILHNQGFRLSSDSEIVSQRYIEDAIEKYINGITRKLSIEVLVQQHPAEFNKYGTKFIQNHSVVGEFKDKQQERVTWIVEQLRIAQSLEPDDDEDASTQPPNARNVSSSSPFEMGSS
ncbi:MAG TPA: hypothetical protein VHE99_07010 [Gammaproteobacteria bacterium]|nr:hypothetical protein [Gammaproteobacteria bacterium]